MVIQRPLLCRFQEIDKGCGGHVESEKEMKSRKKIITVSGICIVVLAVAIGAAAMSRKAGQRITSDKAASGQTTAGADGENGNLPMVPIASGDVEADGAAAQQREKSSAEKSAPEDAADMEDQKSNAQSDDQSSIVAKDGRAKQDQSSPAANIQKPSKPQGDNPKDDAQQNAGTGSSQESSDNSGSSGKTDAKSDSTTKTDTASGDDKKNNDSPKSDGKKDDKSNNNTSDGKKNDKSDDQDSGGKNDKSDNKDTDQKSPDTIELPFIPAK